VPDETAAPGAGGHSPVLRRLPSQALMVLRRDQRGDLGIHDDGSKRSVRE
jgi:hypothetical protein